MLRKIAEGYYKQGYNCAEAMLRAINMAWGLRLSDESLRLAAGFGGGMGCEDACGAMTGAVAGLTLHDMPKAVARTGRLDDVRLLEKSGGRSGAWHRDDEIGEQA